MHRRIGMSIFYLHPDDARWMRRWLRNNLLCVSAIVSIVLVIQSASSDGPKTILRADAAGIDRSIEVVRPQGWRRTNEGWQHTSTWQLASTPTGDIARYLPLGEPIWVEFTLAAIRDVPPLVFAAMQIAFIMVIVRFADQPRKTKRNSSEAAHSSDASA